MGEEREKTPRLFDDGPGAGGTGKTTRGGKPRIEEPQRRHGEIRFECSRPREPILKSLPGANAWKQTKPSSSTELGPAPAAPATPAAPRVPRCAVQDCKTGKIAADGCVDDGKGGRLCASCVNACAPPP